MRLPSDHLDNSGFQVSVAEQLAVDEGLVIGALEAVFPECASEWRSEPRLVDGPPRWRDNLVRFWVTTQGLRALQSLPFARQNGAIVDYGQVRSMSPSESVWPARTGLPRRHPHKAIDRLRLVPSERKLYSCLAIFVNSGVRSTYCYKKLEAKICERLSEPR